MSQPCCSEHGIMNKDSLATDSLGPDSHRLKNKNLRKSAQSVDNSSFPNSRKVYVSATIHNNVRVPFRQISLSPTKSMNGSIEVNEPVRVYDTSGPWGDPDFRGNVEQGLPPLRAKWTRERGDVEEIEGRAVKPIDDGWLSEGHARSAQQKHRTPNAQHPTPNEDSFVIRHSSLPMRRPLRAKPGKVV